MLKKSTKYKNTTIFKDRKIVKSYNDIIINNHIKKCKNIDDLKHTLEKTFDSDDLNGCLTILLTNIDTIDKEHLRKYLTLIYDKDESKINKSEFRKLVCYLDFLENA